MRSYIGIDNGATGSIAFIGAQTHFCKIPTKKEQSYTKKKAMITRLDGISLQIMLAKFIDSEHCSDTVRVFIERPMVNPGRFKATVSALRFLEATLICIEYANLSYEYVDSKQWQRVMLPTGIKGSDELKKASKAIGTRLFPSFADVINKQKDADGLLIAEWARRAQL